MCECLKTKHKKKTTTKKKTSPKSQYVKKTKHEKKARKTHCSGKKKNKTVAQKAAELEAKEAAKRLAATGTMPLYANLKKKHDKGKD